MSISRRVAQALNLGGISNKVGALSFPTLGQTGTYPTTSARSRNLWVAHNRAVCKKVRVSEEKSHCSARASELESAHLGEEVRNEFWGWCYYCVCLSFLHKSSWPSSDSSVRTWDRNY